MTAANLHDWRRQYVIRRVCTGLLLAPLVAGTAGAADGWHCAAGVATAYRHDPRTGHWKTLVIPVADQRFVVRPAGTGQTGKRWELVRDSGEPATLPCTGDFDTDGLLRCGTGDQFVLNRKSLVFESHWFSADNNGLLALTAATVVGSCRLL